MTLEKQPTRPYTRSLSAGTNVGPIETFLFRNRMTRRNPVYMNKVAHFVSLRDDLYQSPPRPPPPLVPVVEPQVFASEPSRSSTGSSTSSDDEVEQPDEWAIEQSESSTKLVYLESDANNFRGKEVPPPPPIDAIEFSESSTQTDSNAQGPVVALFKCSVCVQMLPRESFAKTQFQRAQRGNKSRCRSCVADYDRLRRYGLDRAGYDALLAKQDNQCFICKCDLAELDLKKVHVDHCHESGEVRGVLCMECNTGIGKLGHSVTRLLDACNYLLMCGNEHNVDAFATVSLSRVVIALCKERRKQKTDSVSSTASASECCSVKCSCSSSATNDYDDADAVAPPRDVDRPVRRRSRVKRRVRRRNSKTDTQQ